MALTLSGGPLASPMIFAFEAWAWRMNDDHVGGVFLQRIAEGVIGGEEEPARATTLDDFLRGADGERVGVEHPLHRIGRAEFSVEIGGAGRMGDEELFLLVGDALHRQSDGGDRHVDDQVDLAAIVPFARDAGGDIGLELMVGGNHCDRLAQNVAAEIRHRHFGGRHRARSGRRRSRPRHVGQHADLHHVVGNLRHGGAARADQKRGQAGKQNALHRYPPMNFIVGGSLIRTACHGTRLSCMADCAVWSRHAEL